MALLRANTFPLLHPRQCHLASLPYNRKQAPKDSGVGISYTLQMLFLNFTVMFCLSVLICEMGTIAAPTS